jgi:hypothetical protein
MRVRGLIIAAAAVAAVHTFAAGCSQELPVRSTLELMDDPLVLEGVVIRCQAIGEAAGQDEECRNAREAIDRIAAAKERVRQPEPAVDPAFEEARAQRRAQEERERQQLERQEQPVDAYSLPLVKDPMPEPSDVTASIPEQAQAQNPTDESTS